MSVTFSVMNRIMCQHQSSRVFFLIEWYCFWKGRTLAVIFWRHRHLESANDWESTVQNGKVGSMNQIYREEQMFSKPMETRFSWAVQRNLGLFLLWNKILYVMQRLYEAQWNFKFYGDTAAEFLPLQVHLRVLFVHYYRPKICIACDRLVFCHNCMGIKETKYVHAFKQHFSIFSSILSRKFQLQPNESEC